MSEDVATQTVDRRVAAEPQPWFRVSGEIDLGHIIQAVVVVGSLLASAYWLGGRFSEYDRRLSFTETAIERIDVAVRAFASINSKQQVDEQRMLADEQQLSKLDADQRAFSAEMRTKMDRVLDMVGEVRDRLPRVGR